MPIDTEVDRNAAALVGVYHRQQANALHDTVVLARPKAGDQFGRARLGEGLVEDGFVDRERAALKRERGTHRIEEVFALVV